jgi:hypothetical protein
VGLRQAGTDAEATFHGAIMQLGNQVLVLRTALLFVRSAVRLVYAELPEPVVVCSPKQAHCELVPRIFRRAAPSRAGPACFGLGTAVVLPVAGTDRLIEHSTTRGERVMRCPRAERGPSRDLDRGSEHVSSDRSILEGVSRFHRL